MENRNLVYPKETIYFLISCVVSAGLYIALFFSLIMLPVLIGLFLLSLCFHAIMMGSIRGNGVKVSESQFPDVYERIQSLSLDMRLKKVPDVFIVQSEGALNAFATRFFGRDMVVLYSEVFELARQQGDRELDFIIAHELAHIKRRHIWKNWLTLPASWIPFLSEAYSRAAEYTCDRHAAHYVNDGQAAKRALTMLGAGKVLYREVNEEAYVRQIEQETNVFVWLSEKLSTHPVLPKRIQHIGQFLRLPDATDYRAPKKKVLIGAAAAVLVIGLLTAGAIYAVSKLDPAAFFDEAMMDDLGVGEVEGETALMTAAADGDTDTVSELISVGEDLEAASSEGETALHYATNNSQLETAEVLLQAGADPNAEDAYSFTPLWNAYLYEDYDMARLLMEYGADPDLEDEYGDTVRSTAEDEGSDEFLMILNEEKPNDSLVN
ncbi:M48 family metallopeptidase [Domibacillus enclensis]|uniref:Zn-dependent protease with chaperone function n=1 Tax=Domibacillus enclensis TaxID=1017273 RepID=A0A1N6S1A8_9BACI|nr:M48 family metallopeptidase [Domibacillus enclensis]SIQ34850.1 Zn-dependent protease with chaperone function [Domibacillus enclensis]